jgi:fumarate reductase flavoprotein subunit
MVNQRKSGFRFLLYVFLFLAVNLTGVNALMGETVDTDVVVIGAGGGGLTAAVSAAENGARVVVLEKNAMAGGNTAMTEGLYGVGSLFAKRQRFFNDKDKTFNQIMDYTQWSLNARLVREWINRSGGTIDWLEGMGVKFEPIHPWYGREMAPAYHAFQGGGISAIKALLKKCQELGVQVLLKAPVTKLLTDGNGKVTGVMASRDGKELKINGKATIIATGGFAGNREMLKKYYPAYSENLYIMGLPHMGDGINMAIEAGAKTDGLGKVLGHGPAVAYDYPKYGVLWIAASEPNNIWVNKNGERYTNEYGAVPPGETLSAASQQPDSVTFSLFDEKIKQRWIKEGFYEGGGILVMPKTPEVLASFEETLRKADKEKGVIKIANNWDEIARWIGADPKTLKSTIDQYNASCDGGYDEVFAKDRKLLEPLRTPPYYAVKLVPTIISTLGGLKVNYRMEVLNKQDKPIAGLYAASVDVGGWSETYNMRVPGNALSFVLTGGRMAGESAAKYSSGK